MSDRKQKRVKSQESYMCACGHRKGEHKYKTSVSYQMQCTKCHCNYYEDQYDLKR